MFRIAHIAALELPSNLVVGEGSDVLLKCGNNTENVTWHIERQAASPTIIHSSALMNLSNISERESGRYQCSVNAWGEQVKSNWASVTVFGKFDCRSRHTRCHGEQSKKASANIL